MTQNNCARRGAKKIARRLPCDEDAVNDVDVLKVRLAEECNWECPYTGKSIAIEALVGKHRNSTSSTSSPSAGRSTIRS